MLCLGIIPYATHLVHWQDGMYQNWARDAQVSNKQGVVWVFPPFHLIGPVLNKLVFEQVNAILILPSFMRYWVAMLHRFPVVAFHEMPYHANLYSIGSRAPASMQTNKPIYRLTAYLVRFY